MIDVFLYDLVKFSSHMSKPNFFSAHFKSFFYVVLFNILFVFLLFFKFKDNNFFYFLSILFFLSNSYFLLKFLKLRNYLNGTPYSKIRSLPVGIIKTKGIADFGPGGAIHSPITGLPCVWYKIIQQDIDSNGRISSAGETISDQTFIIHHGGDDIVVDPEHSEIFTMHIQKFIEKHSIKTEFTILKDDHLNVIGYADLIRGEGRIVERSKKIINNKHTDLIIWSEAVKIFEYLNIFIYTHLCFIGFGLTVLFLL